MNIRFKAPILRTYSCEYSHACVVVKETIDLFPASASPFRSCISKTNNILIDNAEDLETIMLINNLLEYRLNYSVKFSELL